MRCQFALNDENIMLTLIKLQIQCDCRIIPALNDTQMIARLSLNGCTLLKRSVIHACYFSIFARAPQNACHIKPQS